MSQLFINWRDISGRNISKYVVQYLLSYLKKVGKNVKHLIHQIVTLVINTTVCNTQKEVVAKHYDDLWNYRVKLKTLH